MTAALKKALDANEPVVVTGWSPHWKFARWDLKFLDDPKNSFGESEAAYKYVRKGLADDLPEVARFIHNVSRLNKFQLVGYLHRLYKQDGVVG